MDRLRSDSGFALIEAVVSAAVLAMISLAILAGIDGAAASSGREKARNVAASLAEADQERLRAIPVTTLSQYALTAPYTVPDPAGAIKTIDGVKYTVQSTAQWVGDDTSGSVSCTTDSHAAQYFHITSTVTSGAVGPGKPIPAQTIDSILAPNVAYSSTKGTLAVQVLDAAGNPVVNKLVNVSGGTPPPATATNAAGCAVFQQIATTTGGMTYTATISGCVDHFGHDPSSAQGTVNPGRVTLVTMRCDAGKTMKANVYTYAPGATPAAPGAKIASAAFQVSVVNSGETGMLLSFLATTPSTEVASQSVGALFPFPTKYTFFTGNCHYNDPTDSTNYGSANTVSPNGALIAGQQVVATSGGSVDVYQPPLNVQLTKNSSGNAPTASVTVYAYPVAPSTDSCVQPKIKLKTFDTDPTAGYKWMVGRAYDTTSGSLDAGVPYGQYTLCFQSGTTNPKFWQPSGTAYPNAAGNATYYDNTTPPTGQKTTEQLSKSTSWSSGSCP